MATLVLRYNHEPHSYITLNGPAPAWMSYGDYFEERGNKTFIVSLTQTEPRWRWLLRKFKKVLRPKGEKVMTERSTEGWATMSVANVIQAEGVGGIATLASSLVVTLERAVVEAAVALAEASNDWDDHVEWEAKEEVLLDAARALLKAREAK